MTESGPPLCGRQVASPEEGLAILEMIASTLKNFHVSKGLAMGSDTRSRVAR